MGYQPSPRLPHTVPFLFTAKHKKKNTMAKISFLLLNRYGIVQQYGKLVRMYCEIASPQNLVKTKHSLGENESWHSVCSTAANDCRGVTLTARRNSPVR